MLPRALPALVTVVLAHGVAAASPARGEPCRPAVALAGEPALVAAVRAVLAARGIGPGAEAGPGAGPGPGDAAASGAERCAMVRAHVERRGPLLVVGLDGPGSARTERAVTEVATAATVIESWTREDVAAPLLALHALPAAELAPQVTVVAPAPAGPHGIQLFASEGSAIASDGTIWEGTTLGACMMLGPICAAARLHGGVVIASPHSWAGVSRRAGEIYAGLDVPIAIGGTRLVPGFAAGYGSMFTRHRTDDEHKGIEISGPRAEAHVTFSLPITAHIAIELVASGVLTQATAMESHGPAPADPMAYPAEPRAFFRLALGVRYGAL